MPAALAPITIRMQDVTIAPVPSPNQIDDTQFFVRQHYRDFLNREADPDGLAFWTNQISSCGGDQGCIEVKRINDSESFFLSIEFQETGYLAYRTYLAAFGNLPNAPVPITFSEFIPDTQALGRDVMVKQPGWEQVLENNKRVVHPAQFVAAAALHVGLYSEPCPRGVRGQAKCERRQSICRRRSAINW